ncbi:hypothetical protein ACO2Q8_02810 [Larkinella sp. VNQ87]|uniref:hypothetical protein n=1 Tax=Larkinella sp. VNQ87 TaxID=3400921 RepID=UPI003BFBE7B8
MKRFQYLSRVYEVITGLTGSHCIQPHSKQWLEDQPKKRLYGVVFDNFLTHIVSIILVIDLAGFVVFVAIQEGNGQVSCMQPVLGIDQPQKLA